MNCEAVQILKKSKISQIIPGTSAFTLDKRALSKILEADDVKDRQVVLIAIAGAFRTGKSFILGFFLRYLRATVSAQRGWQANLKCGCKIFISNLSTCSSIF